MVYSLVVGKATLTIALISQTHQRSLEEIYGRTSVQGFEEVGSGGFKGVRGLRISAELSSLINPYEPSIIGSFNQDFL